MGAKISIKKNNKELTEKMQIEITDRMTRLKSASDFLCKECIKDVRFLVSLWDEGGLSWKKQVGDLLATLGLTKLFLEIWKKYFEMDLLNDHNSLLETLMYPILMVLGNSMDSSTALCVQVFESDLYKVVLNYLETDYLDPSKTVNPDRECMVDGLMTVLYNMLQKVPESSLSLREYKAFDVFQRFRKSPSNNIACLALILQGYIITEEENELVNSGESNFKFLKDVLKRALMPNNSSRRADGFVPMEVISALNRLAVNDNNKTRIVNVGLLPFYVKLLQPQCSEEEQEAAAEGLWSLAFKCTHELKNEPGCLSALKILAKTNSERLKRVAKGTLWIIEESQKKENPRRQVSRSEADHEGQGHVFISYQWDSQPMIKKIVNGLKQEGFKVWVDFDRMSGSILEAMAKAVEEAAVVIICLSQKYKESPNCRTEAEYTFRLRKEILPLRLQSLYWPDGWLGALVGNRLMHDFTSEKKYLESIKALIRELGVRGKTTEHTVNQFLQRTVDEPDSNVDTVTKVSVPTTESSGSRISKYATWTSEEIVVWLQENNLEAFQDWFKDFDGTLLMEYKTMLQTAPEAFYSALNKEFSQKDTLKLSKALRQL